MARLAVLAAAAGLATAEDVAWSCPKFLKPLCDLAGDAKCLAGCMPRLGSCILDKECRDSVEAMGLCMAKMKLHNATADETQACLVPDNRKRSDYVYCIMDTPGCLPVPTPPSQYPACQDEQLPGDAAFELPHVLGDWYKVKGWKKGELVECLPCQQVKFWNYDPATPLPWPSPLPPNHTEDSYTVISSSWHEQDSKGKYWPMNQTSLWGPRPGRKGFPAKQYSLGTMFGLGYREKYTVLHDGSADAEPFMMFYACGETKQGAYVSGLILARTPTISAALQAKIASILQASGFEAGDWCDVDNSCQQGASLVV